MKTWLLLLLCAACAEPPSAPPTAAHEEVDRSFFRSAAGQEQKDRILASPADEWWHGTYEGAGFETLIVSSAGYYFEKFSDLGMACESWGDTRVVEEGLVFAPRGQRSTHWRIPESVHPVRCAAGRWLVRSERWEAFVSRFRRRHDVPQRSIDYYHEQGFDDDVPADCVLTSLSGREL